MGMIEMNDIVHEFVAGDHSHPQSEEIYSKLDEMIEDLKISRYLPNTLEVSLQEKRRKRMHSIGTVRNWLLPLG